MNDTEPLVLHVLKSKVVQFRLLSSFVYGFKIVFTNDMKKNFFVCLFKHLEMLLKQFKKKKKKSGTIFCGGVIYDFKEELGAKSLNNLEKTIKHLQQLICLFFKRTELYFFFKKFFFFNVTKHKLNRKVLFILCFYLLSS